jgi:hypothetical protein
MKQIYWSWKKSVSRFWQIRMFSAILIMNVCFLFFWHAVFLSAHLYTHSKPSLIRLQLIRGSDNPDRKIKNCVRSWVHTSKDTWDLGARGIRAGGLSDYIKDSWRDRNHTRKYPRLASAGWRRPWISVSHRGRNCCSDIFYLFLSALAILFNFTLFSKFFVLGLPLASLIRMTPSQWIRTSKGLLYVLQL